MSTFLQDVSPEVEGSMMCLCVIEDKEKLRPIPKVAAFLGIPSPDRNI